jgi:hypothetical protein
MEQSTSWEANSCSAIQEILRVFMEPEGSLQHSQEPTTCPDPKPDQSSPSPPPPTIPPLEHPF